LKNLFYILIGASTVTSPTTSPCIPSSYTSYMSTYNVIVLDTLQTRSDIEGRTIVCSKLIPVGSTFGNKLTQTSSPFDYTLEINGTTTNTGSNLNIEHGDLGLGPYSTNRFTLVENSQYKIDNNFYVNINQGSNGATVKVDNTLPSKCANIVSSITSLSTTLSQLSPNNVPTYPTNTPGTWKLYVTNVDANGLAVFNLSLATAFDISTVQALEIIVQNTNVQLVVVNLYGQSNGVTGTNFIGTWLDSVTTGRSRTIWNIYQATSLKLETNLKGALLAPYADVTTNINIDGAVAVRSLYTNGEVHLPLLQFPPCASMSTQLSTASTSTTYKPTTTGTGPTTTGLVGSSTPSSSTYLPTGVSTSLISKSIFDKKYSYLPKL